MTDAERITKLEERLAAAEARIAQLEVKPLPYIPPFQPYPVPVTTPVQPYMPVPWQSPIWCSTDATGIAQGNNCVHPV